MQTYSTTYSTTDVHKKLLERTEQTSIRETAEALGFSYKYVYDALHHARGISPRLAQALGYVQLPKQYVTNEDYARAQQ